MIELNKLTLQYKALFEVDDQLAPNLSKYILIYNNILQGQRWFGLISGLRKRSFGDDVLCIFNGDAVMRCS